MPEHSLQNMLVGLDLTPTDKSILRFLSQNHRYLNINKIDFIHIRKEGSESKGPSILQELSRKISNTGIPDEKTEILIKDGDPQKQIKEHSRKENTDLLVLGYKHADTHDVEAKKLVKKSINSLLLIPEKKNYELRRIGIAIDFSELSLKALKIAQDIATKASAELLGLHCYQVPSGYHKSGMERDEFAGVMEENAREDMSEFLNKAEVTNINMTYTHDEKGDPAEYILQFAHESNVDLLVIASKGRTGAASLLLGSVAKRLVRLVNDIPLLVIKDKKDRMDVIDALKEV